MPQSRFPAEAFGLVTICLVACLILLGLLCILYSLYFHYRVRREGFFQLSYFSGPWIIRITFVLFIILWGSGEILRLSYLRWSLLDSLDPRWQENFCKGYIISNLGFAEPCLFLTLLLLLRASLEETDSGILSRKWNGKTAMYVMICCFPLFALQLCLVLVVPQIHKVKTSKNFPHYFTRAAIRHGTPEFAFCTYPLLNTILHGLFALMLTVYLFWLGRRILKLVINKGLQKRVYTLIVSVSVSLPLRVLLLGLSVLWKPEDIVFETLAFLAFLALSCCAGVCICMLVYYPVADALALGNLQDLEARRRMLDGNNEAISLLGNETHPEGSGRVSPVSNSDTSTKRGSISFRAYEKDGTSTSSFVELSLFSPSHGTTPPGSPPLLGWPMRAPSQGPWRN